MSAENELTSQVKEKSKKLGLDIVGFADPVHFQKYKDYAKRNRPEHFLKSVQTVIIVGIHLEDLILDMWYQSLEGNYHFADMIIENKCYGLQNYLVEKGFETTLIPYSPGLFLKDSAALAGIGPIGKNNLLITEQYGSQLRLRALVTDATLSCGTPITESNYCEDCNLCEEACPADALNKGRYNRMACETYQLNNLMKLSDNSSIWCNRCIEACPIGPEGNK
jgi:epoxyqueuosine reductase QueG